MIHIENLFRLQEKKNSEQQQRFGKNILPEYKTLPA